MARMPNTRMNEAQNPMSLKERGDKSPNCPRLSWLLTLYASQISWLEYLEDQWREVEASCGELEFKLEIPSRPALFLLKILALAGKLARVVDLATDKEAQYEERQFVEHARDLLAMNELIEAEAEIPELVKLARRSAIMSITAREVSLAIQAAPQPFRGEEGRSLLAESSEQLIRVLEF